MVVKTENLALSLSGGKKTLFHDIAFELGEGEIGIITGRAGSGKTLLGLTLCGFLPLWVGNWKLEGQIELFGKPLEQGEYRNEVGIILENPYAQISGIKRDVLGELAFPLECRGIKREIMHGLINHYAHDLGISHLLKRKVKNLSGGELQRVIIASTLLSRPRFLFIDRLMTEIDTEFRPQLLNIISSHIKEVEGSALIAEDPWLLPDKQFQKRIQLDRREEDSFVSSALSYEISTKSEALPSGDLLSVESLYFKYGDENPVLNDFSFSIGSGELLFFTGPNGGGKTTLAKIIAGIMEPSSGRIILGGEPFTNMEQWEIMSLVGLALQNPGLHLCRKTVREEFVLAKQWGNSSDELIGILGLDNLLDCHPLELTQAEKKRLVMALAYGKQKKVIILDEPSQYQDWEGFKKITDAVNSITAEGKTVIIITHDPRFFHAFSDSAVIRLFPVDSY